MATTEKYHVMRISGRTRGQTKGSKAYTYEEGDIIEAPATEFSHLPDEQVETYDTAEEAKENA